MFAGNQIQPSKTAACLKARRWVADYEEGLQKIYYKDNICLLYTSRHGFLNDIKHTGDSLELFQSQCGYSGQALYVPAQVVVDGGFITANETAAVEFAYEIFKILKVDSDVEMAKWYDNFKYGAIR